jgi:hypothetical protein
LLEKYDFSGKGNEGISPTVGDSPYFHEKKKGREGGIYYGRA